jgi:uncharacterized protein YbjT (DUF2867 family)
MKIALAGSSGEIGKKLLALINSDEGMHATILNRRHKDLVAEHTTQRIVDFDSIHQWPDEEFDAVISCLGSTMKKAGSKKAFRKVDFDYVVNLAKWAKHSNTKQFHVVSASGANASSLFFYNRVKGDMEAAVSALGIAQVCIYKPGLLDSERAEKRSGERLMIKVFRGLNRFLPKRYRSVRVEQVARVIYEHIHRDEPGLHTITSDRFHKV